MKSNDLERLAMLWRYAEDYYLETRSGWQKDRLYRFQKSLNLTENETKEIEEICYSIGI